MYNMKKERSYWEGTHAANRRIMYLAAGYEQEDIVKKPHIGIANTFFEGSPGTGHLRSLAESVKKGIWMNGGMPMEFGVPATCGNIATGSDGLRYELVLRDIVAMSIEAVVRVHKLDGLVILASCDNVIAGAYLAALRVHIPCIVVTGGIMGGRKLLRASPGAGRCGCGRHPGRLGASRHRTGACLSLFRSLSIHGYGMHHADSGRGAEPGSSGNFHHPSCRQFKAAKLRPGRSLYRRAGPARHMPGRFNEPGGSFQYSDAGSGHSRLHQRSAPPAGVQPGVGAGTHVG